METKQDITANIILGTVVIASTAATLFFTAAGSALVALPCLAVAGFSTLGILNWNLS